MEEIVKEQPIYEVQKVKVKNNQLTAEYTEKYIEANYKNNVTKSSEQFIHPDLRYALDRLKTHVTKICEMHEAIGIDICEPTEDDLNEKLKCIVITGYSKGGYDESAGVSIKAQKLLKSGQVLNLAVPFTKFEDESGEGYPFGENLREIINRESLDFDTPVESEITCLEESSAPKKRGRKKKEENQVLEEIKAFDEYA